MKLTKAYVKYIDGGDTFWIDPIDCFKTGIKKEDCFLIIAYDDFDGKPNSNSSITLNMSNVIYIRWIKD